MKSDSERWTSANIPSRLQLRSFQDVLSRTHLHWDLTRTTENGYHADVVRRKIGDFYFSRVAADPVIGRRNSDSVRQDKTPYFCLYYLDQGVIDFQQGPNQCVITRGKVAIWDSARPACFNVHESVAQVSVLVPHRLALSVVPGIEDLCGASVDGASPLGSLLLSHLRNLHGTIETINEEDRPAVLRATMELVGAAFRPTLALSDSSSFRRALIGRVQEHIMFHLHDPKLSASSIAATFRISPSYLHRLFKTLDLSVGDWIRKRRLDAARQALSQGSGSRPSITSIAMNLGFSDPSHFSHAFKKEFGAAPSEFRRGH